MPERPHREIERDLARQLEEVVRRFEAQLAVDHAEDPVASETPVALAREVARLKGCLESAERQLEVVRRAAGISPRVISLPRP